MDLYILRHAVAEDRVASGPGGDRHRRLTADGIRKMRRAALGMKRMGLDFEVMVASPFARAKETAEIVASLFKPRKGLAFSPALVPDGSPAELITELKRAGVKGKSVLIVGHEPYLSRLISLLISGDTSVPILLKKGGLCKLSVATLHYGRCATLEWLLTPRQLRSLE